LPQGCVDINHAGLEDLKRIIHIDDVRGTELISLRPFSSIDDMTRINGIGPSRLADIKAQGVACISPP
jgi:DNA uptake protein ComE-like DNA-binding protein